METRSELKTGVVSFGPEDMTPIQSPQTDALIIQAQIEGHDVQRILIDTGSSVNTISTECLEQMGLDLCVDSTDVTLFGFTEKANRVHKRLEATVVLGDQGMEQEKQITFMVTETSSPYNAILGRPALNQFQAVISLSHLIPKSKNDCYCKRITRWLALDRTPFINFNGIR